MTKKSYCLFDRKTGHKFHRQDGLEWTKEDFDEQQATMISKYQLEDGSQLVLIEEEIAIN